MKTFEVNLGIGLNQFFPETIKITLVDEDDNFEVENEIKKPKKRISKTKKEKKIKNLID